LTTDIHPDITRPHYKFCWLQPAAELKKLIHTYVADQIFPGGVCWSTLSWRFSRHVN